MHFTKLAIIVVNLFTSLSTTLSPPQRVQCPPPTYNENALAVLLPHPTNCSKFFICNFGYPVALVCPKGLYFNPKLTVCDWPYHAGCKHHQLHPYHPDWYPQYRKVPKITETQEPKSGWNTINSPSDQQITTESYKQKTKTAEGNSKSIPTTRIIQVWQSTTQTVPEESSNSPFTKNPVTHASGASETTEGIDLRVKSKNKTEVQYNATQTTNNETLNTTEPFESTTLPAPTELRTEATHKTQTVSSTEEFPETTENSSGITEKFSDNSTMAVPNATKSSNDLDNMTHTYTTKYESNTAQLSNETDRVSSSTVETLQTETSVELLNTTDKSANLTEGTQGTTEEPQNTENVTAATPSTTQSVHNETLEKFSSTDSDHNQTVEPSDLTESSINTETDNTSYTTESINSNTSELQDNTSDTNHLSSHTHPETLQDISTTTEMANVTVETTTETTPQFQETQNVSDVTTNANKHITELEWKSSTMTVEQNKNNINALDDTSTSQANKLH